ncbi:LOW QUALITY PROTEIN: uncharacterized protein C15orf39 homolog [Dipodomys spectabilis]|uniref:LOW QUALITY PROTEIN: uncharacterized protein C15orf39 homolog n=1 Tax=Dipodomys spectabilis TaxID=105255 RepID=UPI001C5367F1|nr:LOW QUALITY PROTEIN: uncharacterized protein C15orf39 homolog [Dipodomys spectabilis]
MQPMLLSAQLFSLSPLGQQWSRKVPGESNALTTMAEKRPLGTLGPVIYGKLPRLEPDTGPRHSLPLSVGSQDPCSYKGAYFSCPMGGPPKAEQLASWTPYPPLYPASVAASPLRTDNLLTNCLLYRPPPEGSEKVPASAELLPFAPQAHMYPAPPLAAPKPVYRSPLCYGLPTCLGEGPAKRPLDGDWASVTSPLLPPADPPCPLTPAAPGKGQSLDATFLRGVPPGAAGKDSSSVNFSACQAFLEKYRTLHGPSFLPSKFTGPHYGDPKPAMAEGPSSPWSRLAQPQESVPTHYPLPPLPQTLPCPPACRHPEKQDGYNSVLSLQPLGAHKGAGYPAGALGSPYLRQPAVQAPYMPPMGLDTYSYSSAPLPPHSPGLKLEPPLAPRCPLDFAPPTLGFPYARDDLSLYGASPGLGSTPPSQNSMQPGAQPSAFPRACQSLPASQPCSEPVKPADKPARGAGDKAWGPGCGKEQCQPQPGEPPVLPIVIPDSPDPRTPPALRPCARELPAPPQKEGVRPPGSPPMPVIDNVFSLAPYRDYLNAPVPKAPPTTRQSPDADSEGAPPAQDGPPGARCPGRQEVALDLSVKKPVAEDAAPSKAPPPPPELPSRPTAAVPDRGHSPSRLPGPKKTTAEAPTAPATTDDLPRTNFHSSVAFMFRKFKILRPTTLSAAGVPSTPAVAPASTQPVPTPPSTPVGLQILTQPLPVACFNLALPSPPALAAASPAPGPASSPASTPSPAAGPAPSGPVPVSSGASGVSLEQHFTGLHASLCDAISGSVAHSPPEKLREWFESTGPWGRAAWQECQAVQGLLGKLLSQLQRFMYTQQCPFPHVVRAGAIFVPIHLVKERLFPRLPPASVDHVLQEHRVELRPTTLSEERVLRERALHGCTSRMLKLLALRQLPDIYPDLLGLQWHDCVRRQLGDLDMEAQATSPSQPTLAREDRDSLPLAQKSPAPKVRKLGRKPPTPGPEREATSGGGGSRGPSPSPATNASPPGPTLRARFRSLLETAWLNGAALPTWSHKAPGPARPPRQPHLLGSASQHL